MLIVNCLRGLLLHDITIRCRVGLAWCFVSVGFYCLWCLSVIACCFYSGGCILLVVLILAWAAIVLFKLVFVVFNALFVVLLFNAVYGLVVCFIVYLITLI